VAPFQATLLGAAAAFAVPGLLLTGLRVLPPTSDFPALLASFISYGAVAYLLSLLLLLGATARARRRRMLAVVSLMTAALMACHLLWMAPFFVPDGRPASEGAFRLLSVNIEVGEADAGELERHAAAADVVVLLETTPDYLAQLEAGDWGTRFPYAVGNDDLHPAGSVIYSRFPLSDAAALPPTTFPQWMATAAVPGIGPVRIVAVHPCNPFCGDGLWAGEHRLLHDVVTAQTQHPLVVAGDFNAVPDHLPMRRLRSAGMRSATDIAGGGWLPTYPGSQLPPLISIDHILLDRGLTASSVDTVVVPGSDHRGVAARIAATQ
jgi:endonuclease/exonuclease/phosphatase (EEP) superfamily protein YafD